MIDTSVVLLDYQASTLPSPLQTGIEGEVSITFKGKEIDDACDWVSFAFVYGEGPDSIFVDKPDLVKISPDDSNWKPSANSPIDQVNSRTFELKNENPGDKVEKAVTVTFSGIVNSTSLPGVITVTENSAIYDGKGRPNFTKRTTSLTVPATKLPPFQIDSFFANNSTTEGHTVTEYTNGQDFYLLWAAQSAVSYEIYQANNLKPIYSGGDTKFHVAKGISRATNFTLIAKSKDGQVLSRSLAINVTNPDLTPRTTLIDAQKHKGDTFTVKGDLMSMTGSNFELDAPATLKQTVTIEGKTTTPSLKVSDAFDSMGINTMGLVATKSLTADVSKLNSLKCDSFKSTGSFAAMGARQLLLAGDAKKPAGGFIQPTAIPTDTLQYTAPTDGFIVCVIYNNPHPTGKLLAGSSSVTVILGKDEFIVAKPFGESINSGSMTIPVPKGTSLSVQGVVWWYGTYSVRALNDIKVYWQPLGVQQLSGSGPGNDEMTESVEEVTEVTTSVGDKLDLVIDSFLKLDDTANAREALKKALADLL